MRANNCISCGREAKITRLEDIIFIECVSRRTDCKKKIIVAAFGSGLAIRTWNKIQKESEAGNENA